MKQLYDSNSGLCSGVLERAVALRGYLYKAVSHETGLKQPSPPPQTKNVHWAPPAQSSSSVKLP